MVNEKKPKWWLRVIGVIVLLLAIFVTIVVPKVQQISQFKPPPDLPTKVAVATVGAQMWNKRIQAIGSLAAFEGITISSEVGGIIKQINFSSGQAVNQGENLLVLENASEIAAVNAAKAQFHSANSQYQRNLKLIKKKLVSAGEVETQRFAVDAAKAQLASATVALQKRQIVAPFTGTLGIKKINVGDYVDQGSQIVTLQSVAKLYLDFTLPENEFGQLKKGQRLNFMVNSFADEQFTGLVQAWEPSMDTSTRTVSVRAIVENAKGQLAPGMFAEISLESTLSLSVFTFPETAIFYNIYGEAVYILEPVSDKLSTEGEGQEQASDFILAAKQVKVLYRKNGQAGVAQGLAEGDQVVIAGQLKLYPSIGVVITEDAPEFDRNAATQPIN